MYAINYPYSPFPTLHTISHIEFTTMWVHICHTKFSSYTIISDTKFTSYTFISHTKSTTFHTISLTECVPLSTVYLHIGMFPTRLLQNQCVKLEYICILFISTLYIFLFDNEDYYYLFFWYYWSHNHFNWWSAVILPWIGQSARINDYEMALHSTNIVLLVLAHDSAIYDSTV